MKIAVLDDYCGAALRLADWGGLGEVTVFSDTIEGPELVARLTPFEVICVMRERTPMDASLVAALPNLRLLVTTGPRNASIDLAACAAANITVSSTASRKTPTPELAMLMMLALNRGLIPEVNALHSSGWQAGLGRDLAGLKLGLIGLGNIGSQMAVLGRAFGMKVSAWSQNLTPERCADIGVTQAGSLAQLLAETDVSTVHLVLSERSENLINAAALATAKTGHVLINTSRGPIVDSVAVLDWLHRDTSAKAGLDVYTIEPLPQSDPLRNRALIESGQLLLTPHLGYATEATFKVFYEQTVEAVKAWQGGAAIRTL